MNYTGKASQDKLLQMNLQHLSNFSLNVVRGIVLETWMKVARNL